MDTVSIVATSNIGPKKRRLTKSRRPLSFRGLAPAVRNIITPRWGQIDLFTAVKMVSSEVRYKDGTLRECYYANLKGRTLANQKRVAKPKES